MKTNITLEDLNKTIISYQGSSSEVIIDTGYKTTVVYEDNSLSVAVNASNLSYSVTNIVVNDLSKTSISVDSSKKTSIGIVENLTLNYDGLPPIFEQPDFYATAFVSITRGQVVVLRPDNSVELASASNIDHAGRIAAIALTSSNAGGQVGCSRVARVAAGYSFVTGKTVYLGIAGDITQNNNIGLFQYELGIALNNNTVLFQPGLCIVR